MDAMIHKECSKETHHISVALLDNLSLVGHGFVCFPSNYCLDRTHMFCC